MASSYEDGLRNGEAVAHMVSLTWAKIQGRKVEELRAKIEGGDSYADSAGVRFWVSNDSPIPPSVYKDAHLPCPTAQVEAYQANLSAFCASYRTAQAEHARQVAAGDPEAVAADAEMRAELAANFEPGTVVVDVLTGQRTRV